MLLWSEPRYADPADRYVARFAPPLRRAGAAVVDWGLCYVIYLIAAIPLGMVQTLGAVSAEAGDFGGTPGRVLVVATQVLTVVPVVAYFALLLPTSQTLGMRVSDVRIVSTRTGRGMSQRASVIRGALATLVAIGCYAVLSYEAAFEKPTELDRLSSWVLGGSYVLAGAAFVSACVMAIAPTHRNVFDRLFRTAVVDELEAVAPVMGPWGPVHDVDTSHARTGRA